jgi:hypothetical protein
VQCLARVAVFRGGSAQANIVMGGSRGHGKARCLPQPGRRNRVPGSGPKRMFAEERERHPAQVTA